MVGACAHAFKLCGQSSETETETETRLCNLVMTRYSVHATDLGFCLPHATSSRVPVLIPVHSFHGQLTVFTTSWVSVACAQGQCDKLQLHQCCPPSIGVRHTLLGVQGQAPRPQPPCKVSCIAFQSVVVSVTEANSSQAALTQRMLRQNWQWMARVSPGVYLEFVWSLSGICQDFVWNPSVCAFKWVSTAGGKQYRL